MPGRGAEKAFTGQRRRWQCQVRSAPAVQDQQRRATPTAAAGAAALCGEFQVLNGPLALPERLLDTPQRLGGFDVPSDDFAILLGHR